MPTIRPVSDLHRKYREIERLCRQSAEPILLTRRGRGAMVVMSLATYERERARLELYRLLDEAEADVRAGDRGVSVRTARARLAQ